MSYTFSPKTVYQTIIVMTLYMHSPWTLPLRTRSCYPPVCIVFARRSPVLTVPREATPDWQRVPPTARSERILKLYYNYVNNRYNSRTSANFPAQIVLFPSKLDLVRFMCLLKYW